jgi:hypothetical protein
MHTFYQNFIGTADEWASENPRLYKGVAGIEMDGGKPWRLKIGDGVHAWQDLDYLKTENVAGLPEEMRRVIEEAVEAAEARAEEVAEEVVAAEAAARTEGDEALQGGIDAEKAARKAAVQGEAGARDSGDQAEALARGETAAALQLNINLEAAARLAADGGKIDKAAAGDEGTLMQSITIKEDTPNSVIVTGWSRDVNAPGDAIPKDVALPMASEAQAGIMPAESFSQIGENTTRIAALEGRSVHYPVTLASATPSQGDLQEAYEEASGSTGAAPDQATLDDTAFGKSYTWYESEETWVDRGTTQVAAFTNASAGVIKGDNADGKVFAEENGTGSVVGWDALKARTANLESGKVNNADTSAAPAAGKVAKYDEAGGLSSGAAPTEDNGVVRKADLEAFFAAKLSLEYPVGCLYVQYPSDYDPYERGLPGSWEPWSYRASLYAIGNTAPSAAFIADWKTYRHDVWGLNTDNTVATQGTKKYAQPGGYTCVARQDIQADWEAADLTEGTVVTIGGDTKYIWQVIAFAGIFFGVEDFDYPGGRKRPEFISGGVQPYRIKNIKGEFSIMLDGDSHDMITGLSGAFFKKGSGGNNYRAGHSSPSSLEIIDFDPSLVVPTGDDNAGTNLSRRFWRRYK